MRKRRFLFWGLMVGTLFLLPGMAACDFDLMTRSCVRSGALCERDKDCCSQRCRIEGYRLGLCAER
jgi:hypothetical protein